MPVTKQRTLDDMEYERGTHAEHLHNLPETEQTSRLTGMGHAAMQDLLTHILVWWVEELRAVRLALIALVTSLHDDAFRNRDIESWLAAVVVEHHDGHALPQ